MNTTTHHVISAEDRLIGTMTLSFLTSPLVLLALAGAVLAAGT